MNFTGAFSNLDQSKKRPEGKLSSGMTIHLVFFFVLVFTLACTTISTTREFNRPWGVVRATVQKNMPLGIRTTSRNGRTFESNYFIPKGNWDEDGTSARERAFAKTTILGSSRPYQVEVAVFRQQKTGGEYSAAELDGDLSERLANRIETDIANRREDRNIIDDFKPF